jgi:hypothetical protein
MQSGLDGEVRALAVDGGLLYAGGCFTHAGGGESPALARWEAAVPTAVMPPAGGGVTLSAAPNPFAGALRIRLGASRLERTRLVLYDLQGRAIALLHEGPLDGPAEIAWSCRSAGGRNVPTGVYFLRLEHSAGTVVRRVLRLP